MLSGLASVELPSLALSSGLFEMGGMFMIEPFNAVGLVPTVWGVRNRREIEKNIELRKELNALKMDKALDEVSEGLTETQKEKFISSVKK